jgi:hypothetical protein
MTVRRKQLKWPELLAVLAVFTSYFLRRTGFIIPEANALDAQPNRWLSIITD